MKGVKELKARIKSVTNIQKITSAMEMVAATKLRRLQDRALSTRPFADRIEAMMRRVAAHADPDASPLLQVPDKVTVETLVIVGADKGLCGAYNSNLARHALKELEKNRDEGVATKLYIFGRRPQGFFSKLKDADVAWVYGQSVEKIQYPDIRRVMNLLVAGFLDGEVQRVRVIYTEMKSMAVFTPTTQGLLPVTSPDAAGEESGAAADYILEPSPDVIMKRLLPRYLEMQLYAAALESLASEFAARRMAMKNATDAADDMLETLATAYNKARQEGITNELLDLVGGVVAS
ncbi:MAG: ATP synthase F1 subunit gamma [Phycisphaeraceae bacterium]|nr:ATP synthase F1 subunit gamma [Phycisphaeraceae bacterium]